MLKYKIKSEKLFFRLIKLEKSIYLEVYSINNHFEHATCTFAVLTLWNYFEQLI